MAAVLCLCFGANAADGFGGVTCQWHRELGQYLCEGTGNQIIVTGGADQAITNMFGGCTNCINVTPEMCVRIKGQVTNFWSEIEYDIQDIYAQVDSVVIEARRQLDEIATYRTFDITNVSGVQWDLFTNYVYNVENEQTSIVAFHMTSAGPPGRWRAIGVNNGIYDFANNVVAPTLEDNIGYVETIRDDASYIYDATENLVAMIQRNLNCNACSTNSASCDCNDSTGGRWCTEEQGRAIIKLLTDTEDHVEKMKDAVKSIAQNVHDGFFTEYTHIPTEEELGHTWQELYLEGYSSNFHEYASTNILARIELLLAGMSGVLTNNSDFAEAGRFAENGMDVTNEFENIQFDLTNEVQNVVEQRERNVRSVGDALVGLYDTFRGWSGTPFSRTTLIMSYSLDIGEGHYDVPAFEPSEQGVKVANIIRVICRSIMSVIYIFFTISVFIRFHIAFFEWVWKYVKWGVELMQGLFA